MPQNPSSSEEYVVGDAPQESYEIADSPAPAAPKSGLTRAYEAVGTGFKAPFQGTADLLAEVNTALGKKGGIAELLAKHPAKHQGVLNTLKDAYGSMLPIDVPKDTPEGVVDLLLRLETSTWERRQGLS